MTAVRPPDGDRENVALLSIDSLRADHCGFLGQERDTTPTLDRLAADGVVYENAIAPGPRTPSSMPVAFTGAFPEPSTFEYADWGHRYGRISEHLRRHRTLPQRLQRAGYTTVGVTLNPWTQKTDFDLGFDRFVEVTGETVAGNGDRTLISALDRILNGTGLGERLDWHLTRDWFIQWPHYYERILEAIEDVSEPYFLWVFSLDPHQPYLAPGRFREETSLLSMYYANFRESVGNSAQEEVPAGVERRLKRAYRDAIRSADGFVDELASDLPGDPTLVVHADHGEAFGEHGFWGHPAKLYEENLHVPLLVANGPPQGRVADPVSLRSLSDITLAATDPTGFDPTAFTSDCVLVANEGLDAFALRGHRLKFIANDDGEELYDLREDPGERRDRSGIDVEVSESCRALLDGHRRAIAERNRLGQAIVDVSETERVIGGASQ